MIPRRHREPKVRAETIALARARATAGASLTTTSELPPEHQVMLLKAICRHLWKLLDRRAGLDDIPTLDEIWGDLGPDGACAVDRAYEAGEILFARDRIFVEPCRRPTDQSLAEPLLYTLIVPGGAAQVVTEQQLLMMAGVS